MGSSRSAARLSGLLFASHFESFGKLKTTITSKNNVENENGFSVHIIRNSMRFTRIFCAVRSSVCSTFFHRNLFRFYSYLCETIEIRVSNLFIAIFFSVLKPPSIQTHKHTSAAPAHQSPHNDTKSVSQTIVFVFFLPRVLFCFFLENNNSIKTQYVCIQHRRRQRRHTHTHQHCIRVYLQSAHTKCLCYSTHSYTLFCSSFLCIELTKCNLTPIYARRSAHYFHFYFSFIILASRLSMIVR